MVFISFYQLFANITKTVCLGTIFPPQYMWFSNVTASILLARLHNSIYYFNVNVRKFALVTRREPDVCMGLFIEIILGDGEGADWLAPPPFSVRPPHFKFFQVFFSSFFHSFPSSVRFLSFSRALQRHCVWASSPQCVWFSNVTA